MDAFALPGMTWVSSADSPGVRRQVGHKPFMPPQDWCFCPGWLHRNTAVSFICFDELPLCAAPLGSSALPPSCSKVGFSSPQRICLPLSLLSSWLRGRGPPTRAHHPPGAVLCVFGSPFSTSCLCVGQICHRKHTHTRTRTLHPSVVQIVKPHEVI